MNIAHTMISWLKKILGSVRKKFPDKCKTAQTTKLAKLVANEKKLHTTLTEKLRDYTCKVTGQSVNSEFSQHFIISIIRVMLGKITSEKYEIAQNLAVPLMLDY